MELGRFRGKLEELEELLDAMSFIPDYLKFYLEIEYGKDGEYRGAIKTRLGPKAYKRESGDKTLDSMLRTYSRWTLREMSRIDLEPSLGEGK